MVPSYVFQPFYAYGACNTVGTSTESLLDQRKIVDERALEKEEDYFNIDSDDDEDSASAHTASCNRGQPQPSVVANGTSRKGPAPPRTGVLVDEDDEDYKSPPKRVPDVSDDDEGATESRLKHKLGSKRGA